MGQDLHDRETIECLADRQGGHHRERMLTRNNKMPYPNHLSNLIFVVSILDFGERNHPCFLWRSIFSNVALQVVASQAVRSQAHRTSLPETPKTSEASGETL